MITALSLTDFRSYESARLEPGAGITVLHGPNGAGKTNVLEALSFLTPGRGLRGAGAGDVGRREQGEAVGRAWAVAAVMGDGERRLGTGVQSPGAARRVVRIDGEPAQPGDLLDHIRPIWAAPDQDRLFSDSRAERLKFFDRLVFAARPSHAHAVAAYDKALRERLRLLTDAADREAPPDPLWLDALEARLAENGAAAALNRAEALVELQAAIDARAATPFPQGDLSLIGEAEQNAASGVTRDDLIAVLTDGFRRARARDGAASRSLFGPHRTDLTAIHREKGRAAAEGSSGEQKALVLNLILAQLSRLADGEPKPILLLDEAPAHLDDTRRAALFDEIEALGLQAFMTGTERGLFDALEGRATFVRVSGGGFGRE